MKPRTFFSLLTGAATLGATYNASALPDPKVTSAALSSLQAASAYDDRLAGSQLLQDRTGNTIYVSPATHKTEGGSFAATGSATPDQCSRLQSMYDLTYDVPQVPEDQWAAVAKQGPFSPYFDLVFGNYIRYASLEDAILQAATGEETFKALHKTEYENYVKEKTLYDDAAADLRTAKAAYDALDANVLSAQQLVTLASTPADRAAAQAMVDNAIATRTKEQPQAKEDYRKALLAEMNLRAPYAAALAAWAPYQANLTDISTKLDALQTVSANVNQMAKSSFDLSSDVLSKMESRPVGYAAAAYSVFADEVSAAASHLRAAGITNYAVAALPVFDVTATTAGSATTINVSSASPMLLGSTGLQFGGRVFDPAISLFDRTRAVVTTRAAFTDATGRPIRYVENPIINQGSGSFGAPVSLGAYCTGTSSHQTKRFVVNGVTFDHPIIAVQPSPVLTQAVALNYKYYVQADPISISCNMNIDKAYNFWRSSGSQWDLFSSHSWDDTRRSQLASSGIECTADGAPTGANPDQADQQALLDWKLQRMEQEVMAEFILTYGKSWTVQSEMAANPLPDAPHGLSDMGTALLGLCGPNPYCAVTGLVLKSLNEIYGSTSGTTSTDDHLTGSISRKYSLNTWRVVPGSAVINVNVRL